MILGDFMKINKSWEEVNFTDDQLELIEELDVISDPDNTWFILHHAIIIREGNGKYFITRNRELIPKNIQKLYRETSIF